MPSTQMSAEDTVVYKTYVVSVLTELGVQGMSRKDKRQTSNYSTINCEGRVEVSTRSYQSEAEKVISSTNITTYFPPKFILKP